jgi:hypothetical protein
VLSTLPLFKKKGTIGAYLFFNYVNDETYVKFLSQIKFIYLHLLI